MNTISMKNGAVAGIILAALYLIIDFTNKEFLLNPIFSAVIPFALFLTAMIFSVIQNRNNGMPMTFSKTFGYAFQSYVVYSLIAWIATAVLYNVIDPSLIELQKAEAMKNLNRLGGFLNEDQLETMANAVNSAGNQYSLSNTAISYLSSLIIPGGIVSLIVAAIMYSRKQIHNA